METVGGRLGDPRVPHRGSTPARPARHLGKPSFLTLWNRLQDRAFRHGRSLLCREPGGLPGAAWPAVPACGDRVGRPRRRRPSDARRDQAGRRARLALSAVPGSCSTDWPPSSSPAREVVGIPRIRPELVAPGLGLTVSCQAAQLAARTVPAPYVVPRAGRGAREPTRPYRATRRRHGATGNGQRTGRATDWTTGNGLERCCR